jgi:hypothetical protein
MKRIITSLVVTVLTVSSLDLVAQDSQRPSGRRGGPPVVTALDANKDGTLDATEIANASAALLTLDKNGDGQLTSDELMPARPEGQGGPGGKRGGRPAPPTE